MLGVTTFLGAVWLWLLLVARHRVESGRPPSHPESRASRGWVNAAQGVGGFFGGFLGSEFGGMLEMIAAGVAMAILSVAIVPHQKRIRSGTSRQHRIAPPVDETEHTWDADSG
ncbi:MAG: hypothetical protein F4151_08465 [Gammaproteobacteria bacterium]|nr:hypothetical protein [Gammaproteobacteria bacterium]